MSESVITFRVEERSRGVGLTLLRGPLAVAPVLSAIGFKDSSGREGECSGEPRKPDLLSVATGCLFLLSPLPTVVAGTSGSLGGVPVSAGHGSASLLRSLTSDTELLWEIHVRGESLGKERIRCREKCLWAMERCSVTEIRARTSRGARDRLRS